MKIEIYEKSEPEKEPEKVLRLRLVEQGSNVAVIAVKENGDKLFGGYLVEFLSTGYLRLNSSIDKDVPVKTDSARRICIES